MAETSMPATPTATAIDAVAVAAPKVAAPAQQAPATQQPTQNAQPTAPEWFEVPVDGKKVRMSKEELFQAASLGKAANKRFEEAALMRKEAEGLMSRLRDPKKAIELLRDPKLGLDENQVRAAFEEWYTNRFIAREQMTPEQRELADTKERLQKFEEQEAERKKAIEQEEMQRQDAETSKYIQQEIIKTIEESGLPKSKFIVQRIAYWTGVNESKGLNAPRQLIIDQVRKEMKDVMNGMIQSSDGDILFDLLGSDTVKKIRSHDLAKIRAKRATISQPPTQTQETTSKTFERLTESDVRKRARDLWK